MRTILFLLFIIWSNITICGTIDPNIDDQKYIDYAKDFHCVVRLEAVDAKDTLYAASAVLIDDRWMLTAAHVVENCKIVRVVLKNKTIKMNKVIVHKDFDSDKFGFNDIALGYSEEGFGLDFYPELYTNNDEVGKLASISGVGMTGTFISGVSRYDGKKRAGTNYIDDAERTVLVCSASRRNEKSTVLEYLICSGDSGGGLFIDGKLAGINSCVVATDKKSDSSYNDNSCHTRISMMKEWIKDNKK